MAQTAASRRNGVVFVSTLVAVLGLACANWLVWLPAADRLGMPGDMAHLVARVLALMVGLALTAWVAGTTARAGLSAADLGQAMIALSGVYIVFLGTVWGVRRLGLFTSGALLQADISSAGLLTYWLLDGVGMGLLFCGALYAATVNLIGQRNAWVAVWLTACCAVLYMLIGYLSMGQQGDALLIHLATDLVTWLLLTTVYAIGKNMWLVALGFGNVVYSLSGVVPNYRLAALLFTLLMIVAAALVRRGEEA